MHTKSSAIHSLRVMELVGLLAFGVFGQTASTGAIVGTILDPSGSALPGATVDVRNNDTGTARATVSSGEGVYRFPLLGPGSYSLTVKHPGFKVLTRSKVSIDVSTTTTLDLTLELGQTNEVINVTEEAPAVQADSTTVVGWWDRRRFAVCRSPRATTHRFSTCRPVCKPTSRMPVHSAGTPRMST